MEASISLVSMAIERSTCATPAASGKRITAHWSSVVGLTARNGLTVSARRSNVYRGIELGVDERRRPDHRPRVAIDSAHPLVRRIAMHGHIDGDVRLSAPDFACHAGRGEQRGKIEFAALDTQGNRRNPSARCVDGECT